MITEPKVPRSQRPKYQSRWSPQITKLRIAFGCVAFVGCFSWSSAVEGEFLPYMLVAVPLITVLGAACIYIERQLYDWDEAEYREYFEKYVGPWDIVERVRESLPMDGKEHQRMQRAWAKFKFLEGVSKPKPNRVHCDQCCGNVIASAFEDLGMTCTTAITASLVGAEDEEHLSYAYEQGAVLVTHDKDFLILNGLGKPHCGIVIVPQAAEHTHIAAFVHDIQGKIRA